MNSYRFKAVDSNGKIIKGSYVVDNENGLINHVNNKGLYLIEYKLKSYSSIWSKFSYKITSRDLSVLCFQLAQVLRCGINLSQGLKILCHGRLNIFIRDTLNKINIELQNGKGISKSFRKFSNVFPNFMIQLIHIGEQSGSLEQIFISLSEYYEKQHKINKKVNSMLLYPAIILITAIILSLVIIMRIVPEFSKTFIDYGIEPPNSMKKLLLLNEFITRGHFIFFILLILAAISLFIIGGRHRKLISRYKYKIPIVKRIFLEINEIQFARNLKLLINSGITIIASLELMMESEENVYIKDKIELIINDMKSGDTFSQALYNSKIFKNMFTSFIAIGEETGSLEDMLNNIADMYENNIDETINRITKLIEPVIIITLSIIITIIITKLILPIFNTMYSIESL